MSIWTYNYSSRDVKSKFTHSSICIFCKNELKSSFFDSDTTLTWGGQTSSSSISACPFCGWWIRSENTSYIGQVDGGEKITHAKLGAMGSLLELDLEDISTPIDDVKNFLMAKYESRFSLHPKLFEETVASVFKNLGYHSVATAYSGDDGIDVILSQDGKKKIGIQVKRYKNKIEAEQIRSLAGALLLGSLPQGMFITTSEYRIGAADTANRYSDLGTPIELLDAKQFYDALQLSQIEKWDNDSLDEYISQIYSLKMHTLYSETEDDYLDWD